MLLHILAVQKNPVYCLSLPRAFFEKDNVCTWDLHILLNVRSCIVLVFESNYKNDIKCKPIAHDFFCLRVTCTGIYSHSSQQAFFFKVVELKGEPIAIFQNGIKPLN